MANIEERVESFIKPIIENLGYELYDVIYEKEAQDYYLRIFIDKPEGIDLNDCEKVNDSITDMLDEVDYIKDAYFLEVSSPGIERLLRKEKHYQENLGKEVNIKLFKPIEILTQMELEEDKNKKESQEEKQLKKNKSKKNTVKELEGILQDFDSEILEVKIEEQEEIVRINRKDIATIRTKYHWE